MCTNNTGNSEVNCPSDSKHHTTGGEAKSIQVVPHSIVLSVGQAARLSAVPCPENANPDVEWYSDDVDVVAVGPSGHINAVGVGCASVFATTKNGLESYCFVQVRAARVIPVTSIELDRSKLTLQKGSRSTLNAFVCPENATNRSVNWHSDDEDIARVESGVVYAVGSGNTLVTAISADNSYAQAVCSVTVTESDVPGTKPVSSVGIIAEQNTLALNETITLEAVVSPTDATDRDVVWTSSDSSVATVDQDGNVTPQTAGTTVIRATSVADSSKFCDVTIEVKNEIAVKSVVMKYAAKTLRPGDTVELGVTFNPENATNKQLTWESSKPEIVAVDQVGNVTALAEGDARIIARSGNGLDCVCTIYVAKDPVKADEENNTAKGPHETFVADPVDAYSGAHTLQNTLLCLFGGQKISVVARYASNHLAEGSLGKGWYHSYEKHIGVDADGTRLYTSPSTFLQFEPDDDCNSYLCISPGKTGYVLTEDHNSADAFYCLDCNAERREYYDRTEGRLTKVVDHQGFETTVAYSGSLITITDTVTSKRLYLQKNADGKIVRVYDDCGRETLLTYNENNCLTTITDPRGNVLTFTYDSKGRVLSGTDSLGVIYFENTYDSLGRVSTQKDGTRTENACASMTQFVYGTGGSRTTIDRSGNTTLRRFNDSGMLVKYIDENRNAVEYTYDSSFNLIGEKDPLGKSVQRVYNGLAKPTSVTDKNGNTTTLEYDEQGNLTKIIYPADFGTETFTYNSRNQRLTHTDLRGTKTTYTYYSNGQIKTKQVGDLPAETYEYTGGLLTSHTDARGNETRFVYNNMGLVSERTDAEGHTAKYEYDACGNLTKTVWYLAGEDGPSYTVETAYDGNHQKSSEKDANGNITRYTYTGNMKLASTILPDDDPDGDRNVIRYEYDREDHLIKTVDSEENETVTCYDPAGRILCRQAPDGSVVSYEYDDAGRVLRETNALGGVTIRTYDANGNVLTVKDPAGNTTTHEYDARNRLIRTTSPVNGETLYSYSAAGDLLRETDALGNYREYTYDAYGNKTRARDARGNETAYTYDNNNNLLTVTDPLNNVTRYTYDKLNRLTSVTDALSRTVTYTYDAMGRRVTVTDARDHTVTTTYDGVGNVLTVKDAKNNTVKSSVYNNRNLPAAVTDAAQQTTRYTYNKLGKVASVTDPLNKIQTYAYDAAGRNNLVTDALNGESTALYDGAGNILCLEGPLGGKTEYTYDASGRLAAETTPSGGEKEYTYNAQNLKESLTNARGQERTCFYDLLGRVTGCTGPEGTVSYTYDAAGNVLTVTDANGTVTRTYDALNRVTSCTDTFGKTVSYTYDAVGNLQKLTYPDNTFVTYEYDENNNLTKVTDWANRTTTYTYDENNNVTGVTKPNGSSVTTVYDNAQRVTGSVEKTADGAAITGFAYTYDALGRIASETHQPENVRYTYTYDDLSRVTARTATDLSNNTQTQETYAYDAAGNLVSSGSNAFTYGTNNRLTAVSGQTVSYDADGNMTASPLGSFTYDSGNRLLSAGGHTYTYNAEDVRIRNQYTDADVTYVYDTNVKLNRMLTKTENGVTTKFVYGLGLIGEEVGSAFRTYHFDSRGSTVAITDQTGTVTDTFKYDTYGKLLSRTGTTAIIFGYNGRDGVVTDTNGLIYMRARYYSPELRRFVNADIIPGEISDSTSLNRYSYVNGNPVSFVDPFGLSKFWGNLAKVVIGATVIIGAAVTAAVAAPATAVAAGAVLVGAVIGGTAGAISGYKAGGWDEAATGFLTGSVFGGASGLLTASGLSARWVVAGGAALDVVEYAAEDLINGTPENITLAGAAMTAATSLAFDHVKINIDLSSKALKSSRVISASFKSESGWQHAEGVLAGAADSLETTIEREARRSNWDYAQKRIGYAANSFADKTSWEIAVFGLEETVDSQFKDPVKRDLVEKADGFEKNLRK